MIKLTKPQNTQILHAALDFPESELVVALVGPVGTDLQFVQSRLTRILGRIGYTVEALRLSDYLTELDFLSTKLQSKPEFSRISSRMDAGNEARRISNQREFLALRAIADLHLRRKGSLDNDPEARLRTAYILRSLKTPEEVYALRRVYGPGFVLIGAVAGQNTRIKALMKRGMSKAKALELASRDELEEDPDGQRTQDTFHLSDAFVPLDRPANASKNLARVIDLLFGHPFHTPTRDEYGMFLAYSAALRSADLSRQVGAVVLSDSGNVIATGCNDVPSFGGGLYWSDGEADYRDFRRGFDSNARRRDEITHSLLERIPDATLTPTSGEKGGRLPTARKTLEDILKRSGISDITEYGRAVHAEMEALLSCARSGVSPLGGTLYSTTFPCHNCAKHIVAAGIRRVVYIEPYAKSRAIELHDDAITLTTEKNKVQFEPFAGIGPRRFVDLFSISLGSGIPKLRKKGVDAVSWDLRGSRLRVPMLPTSYLRREMIAAKVLEEGWTRARESARRKP